MSDIESSDTSDEEYIPKEASESDSDDHEVSHESDLEEYKSNKNTKTVLPEQTAEEKEKNSKQLWESFKTDVEKEKDLPSKISETSEQVKSNEDINEKSKMNSVVNNSVISSNPMPNLKLLTQKRPAASGLSLTNILGQSKKPKQNMLQKSKEDWDKFVDEEGIKNDLKIFNRGKHGFLERKAFEARTEMKQYEIERDLRLQKKVNK